jgi:hypothetical protein
MAGPTRRDLVWDAALRALESNSASIRLRDVQFYLDEEEVSDRTVRRTLHAMQTLGWLEKDSEGSHDWFPGPKAQEFFRVPEDVEAENTTPIEPSPDGIEEAVATVNVRAEGVEMVKRRRALLQEILKYIRKEGEAKPSQLRARFYPDSDLVEGVEKSEAADAVGYGSERSWWKNFVYMTLSEVDVVETGGVGSHTWFYVGEE